MSIAVASLARGIQTWAEPIGALGTLVLTGFLVRLYQQQKQLLKNSYDADHRAVVAVEDYTIGDDSLELQLSNVGNGLGTNLQLVTATVFEETGRFNPSVATSRVQMSDNGVSRGRQSIKSHESHVTFEARPTLSFTYPTGDMNRVGIRKAMNDLDREGVEVLRVHWFLRYQDLRSEYNGAYIDGLEVNVDPDIDSLTELDKQAARMVYGAPRIDVKTLELDLSDAVTDNDRTVV